MLFFSLAGSCYWFFPFDVTLKYHSSFTLTWQETSPACAGGTSVLVVGLCVLVSLCMGSTPLFSIFLLSCFLPLFPCLPPLLHHTKFMKAKLTFSPLLSFPCGVLLWVRVLGWFKLAVIWDMNILGPLLSCECLGSVVTAES